MSRAIAAGVLTGCLVTAAPALAQTELSGPLRDIARAVIVYPVLFDPLAARPLTPFGQAAVDVHGTDVAGVFHAAVRSGDDSYGIVAEASRSSPDSTTGVDPSGLRQHASLGFHLTNIIWHPKAKRALEEQLGAEGFLRLSDSARAAVTRTLETADVVDVPWVLFISGMYRFNRAEYVFADPTTLDRRTDTRLNDTASMLSGVQFLVRPGDPGYFVGCSYTYSAVFDDADVTAANGLPLGGPTKIRRNLVTIEMRRPLVRARAGIVPSFTYERNSRVRTVETAAYWWPTGAGSAATGNLAGPYVGLRVGNESAHAGRGGFFATVFVGTAFRLRR